MQRLRHVACSPGMRQDFLRHAAVLAALITFCPACPTARADVVGFWKFNAGSGTVAADTSGYNNTGSLVSGASWFNDSQRGWVLSTNYSNQRVEVPFTNASSLATMGSAFTMSMWVNETANSNYGHLLVLSSNGSARNWLWQSENASGGDSSYVWSTTVTAWQKNLGWTITNGAWAQHTFTYEAGNLRSYRNGVSNGSYTISGSAPLPQVVGTWNIGGWNATNSSFRGYMSDVSFWNEGLSVGKAESMYTITTVNSGILADYDALRMKSLFTAYDTNQPATIASTAGALTWSRFNGVSGTVGAATYDSNSSTYRVWFDGTSGMFVNPVPEIDPAGLGAVLAIVTGALGLLERRRSRR